eukprot:755682-Hanusia_phi.AAC.3
MDGRATGDEERRGEERWSQRRIGGREGGKGGDERGGDERIEEEKRGKIWMFSLLTFSWTRLYTQLSTLTCCSEFTVTCRDLSGRGGETRRCEERSQYSSPNPPPLVVSPPLLPLFLSQSPPLLFLSAIGTSSRSTPTSSSGTRHVRSPEYCRRGQEAPDES